MRFLTHDVRAAFADHVPDLQGVMTASANEMALPLYCYRARSLRCSNRHNGDRNRVLFYRRVTWYVARRHEQHAGLTGIT